MIRAITKSLYGIQAAVFLVAGISVLLLGTSLLPSPVRQLIKDIAQGNNYTLHIMQELGSLLVLTGLITLWFLRHYEQSRSFHWAMTVFWALFALVHWFNTQGQFQGNLHTLVDTVPAILFLVLGIMRRRIV